ncbi:hypothetical protein B0T13DRAFT_400445 [Neurospora crassa]|nr:hypothetical protein B0T13DRAFT_400445 [Neurospora crassa]
MTDKYVLQAVQHEAAEDSDGAAASSSEALPDQLVPAMQELDINAILENSALAAKVDDQAITLQNQAATLNGQAIIIKEQANVLHRFEKTLETLAEDTRAAVETANVVQDQIGRYVGPVEKHGNRLNFIEAKQEGSGNSMLACLQRMGEFTSQLKVVRAELAATRQELAASKIELVEINVALAAIKEELAVVSQHVNAIQTGALRWAVRMIALKKANIAEEISEAAMAGPGCFLQWISGNGDDLPMMAVRLHFSQFSTAVTELRYTLPSSELEGGPPPPCGDSVWSIFQHGIDIDPERAALISFWQPANHLEALVGKSPCPAKSMVDPKHQDSMLIWSYDQMQRGAARLGAILDRHNVPADSMILTFIPHSVEWSLVVWAAALKCHTLVCRTVQLLHSSLPDDQQLKEYYFRRLRPAVVIVEDEESAAIVDKLRQDAAAAAGDQSSDSGSSFVLGICLSPLTPARRASGSNWISFASDIASPRPPFTDEESSVSAQQVRDRPDRISNIFFTSGTSAPQPKGVPRTTRNVCAAIASHTAFSSSPRSPEISRPGTVGLIFSANMMALSMTSPLIQWYNGGTVVVPSRVFSVSANLEAIEWCGVTNMELMRSQLVLLAKHKDFAPRKIRSIRVIFVSGEIITVGYLERVREMLGVGENVLLVAGFGMTEGVGALGYPSSVLMEEGMPKPLGDVMPVGTATPGTRIKVVDVEKKKVSETTQTPQNEQATAEKEKEWEVVPRGKQGELHISNEAYVDGYLDGLAPQMFYRDREGIKWFRTGDLAVIDESGMVFVVCRMKDIVKSSVGFFNPTAIEAFLARHLSVEVCVIGIPSPMHGEMPYVILDRLPENGTATDVSEMFSQMMPGGSGFSLGEVITLKELGLDTWPITVTGKMQRHQLRKIAVAYLKTKDISGYALTG